MRSGTRSAGAALGAAAAAALGVPVVLALTDDHLAGAPVLLVASTTAGALAVGTLAVAPWLAARARGAGTSGRPGGGKSGRRALRAHAAFGLVTAVLVAVHVAALVALEPDDAVFAMSPAGPTRARMALLATALLAAVVVLGLLRRRLGWSGPTWRLLHGGLASLAVVLGTGHAVLTDGALEGTGTVVLVVLAMIALAGAAATAGARRAAGARRVRRSAAEPGPAAAGAPAAGTAAAGDPPPGGPPTPTPPRR